MNPAFKIKFQRLDTLRIHLFRTDLEEIEKNLQINLEKYQKFNKLPFILDLQNCSLDQQNEIKQIIELFQQSGLNIVFLAHEDETWAEIAQSVGLHFIQNKAVDENIALDESEEVAAEAANENHHANDASGSHENRGNEQVLTLPARKTYVVNTPVRTGQQVYAEHADLIVLGMVSEGAEVIADGNIHIYAPMRGRALAGASGDTQARIFIQSMQAELVSIAGIYRVLERQLPDHLNKQAVQIELIEERLSISPILAE